MATKECDVVVIGGGPGGYTAAIRAAQLGLKVAVVERADLGGVCLNWGCIPTKSLLHAADVFRDIESASRLGIKTGNVSYDIKVMVKASRDAAAQLNQGVAHLMRKNRIEVVRGDARIAEPGLVSIVGGDEIVADNIIVATGASAKSLPGVVADGKRIWTAANAMTPSAVPGRLLVVGAGAIGVEFASFYGTLGCEVNLIEALPEILPQEDREIAAFARESFVRQGIRVRTGAQLDDVESGSALKCRVNGEAEWYDAIIVSIGVTGNTDGLGLDEIGVAQDRGFITVDGGQRTNVPGIYAIGDVAGPPCLAHKASHEGVVAAEVIAGHAPPPLVRGRIPACTYSHPQVASIGLTEQAAEGREIRIGRYPFYANGKAVASHQAEGMVKTVFDAGSGALLGAHMVGAGVSEMIQGFAIAMQLETTEADLMHTVFPHPTLSEGMHEAVLAAYGRTLNL